MSVGLCAKTFLYFSVYSNTNVMITKSPTLCLGCSTCKRLKEEWDSQSTQGPLGDLGTQIWFVFPPSLPPPPPLPLPGLAFLVMTLRQYGLLLLSGTETGTSAQATAVTYNNTNQTICLCMSINHVYERMNLWTTLVFFPVLRVWER